MAVVFIGLAVGNSVFAGEGEIGKRVLRPLKRNLQVLWMSNGVL